MDSQDLDPGQTVEDLYKQEFELLKGMFENIFSSEVIAGVLEDCDGDVYLAVDTLTKIEGNADEASVAIDTSSNTNVECSEEAAHTATDTTTNTNLGCSISEVTEQQTSNMAPTKARASLKPKYATAIVAPSVNTTITERHRPKNVMPKVDYWTDEIKSVVRCHNEGSRVMVVMRGAPGSGKSYIARAIVDATIGTAKSNIYDNYIFSADDHMVKNGVYHYNVERLGEVHMKNQTRVHKAVTEGRSPVIVDNTNMTSWEMYPYVRNGVQNGYAVVVVEPSNPWSRMASQLAKRNIHGVPKDKIKHMLQRYEGTHNGVCLVKHFKLCYPKDMQPPVLRKIPPPNVQSPLEIKLIEKLEKVSDIAVEHLHGNPESATSTRAIQEPPAQDAIINVRSKSVRNLTESTNVNVDGPNTPKTELQNQREPEKVLDEMLKVEVEWENGDTWESPIQEPEPKGQPLLTVASLPVPKPQRNLYVDRSEKFIEPSLINDDWTKNLPFMESMSYNTVTSIKKETSPVEVLIETSLFDYNQHTSLMETNNVKSQVQHENLNQQSDDKSNAQRKLTTGFHVCEQEDKYFINVRKMFKNIPRPVLREIYDNCAGDANWACSIVLDGIKNKTIQTVDADQSDSEDEVNVECQCEERNSGIPGITIETTSLLSSEIKPQISPPIFKKKPKKEKAITEESSQVLQNIKKSIHISESHYSPYCLNLKKTRYENIDNNDQNASKSNENPVYITNANNSQNAGKISNSNLSSTRALSDSSTEALPSTSQNNVFRDVITAVNTNAVPTTSVKTDFDSMDDEDDFEDDDYGTFESDDDGSVFGDSVSINIGNDFVRILDELHGRHGFEYPAGVKPKLSIPRKILYDLNALWIESVSHQLDIAHRQTKEMIKQDEEFARQVQLELEHEEELFPEEENACALPENAPSLKEIMDTELALAVYERDIKEEWKNKEPQDLAAQMTRRKLYELFPTVSKDILSQVLIAHGNSFDVTVEVLLISTGQGHYLDQSNGANKFVMEKEKENKDKIIQQEQLAALSEEEYPYLFNPDEKTVITMETVNEMRAKAEAHLVARNRYRQKALFYLNRKKFAEADHCQRLGSLYTTRYETASNYAVAALVQYQANQHPEANVIDLHFFHVTEAQVSLDVEIDKRLRAMRSKPAPRPITLRIITGRGKHSPGRPRVRPAIMKRLTDRCLTYRQLNPGLLEVRLKPSHLLTSELEAT